MSSQRQRQLELAGQKTRARAQQMKRGGRSRAKTETPVDPLDGVEFASAPARELAEELDMTWRTFAKSMVTPSSDRGYTKSDVRAVARG